MTDDSRYQSSGYTEAELRKEIAQLRDELITVKKQCKRLQEQLQVEKGLKEQLDKMLAIEVANNLEANEGNKGIFGKLRVLTGLTTVHRLELDQDHAQHEDERMKQLHKIKELTIDNESLQKELDLLKRTSHKEDPQRHLQRTNEDHMIHPGTQPAANQRYLLTDDWERPMHHMTVPVQDSIYQQRGNTRPPPQPFLTRDQTPLRAPLGQEQHQFQFQYQQSPPPPYRNSSYADMGDSWRSPLLEATRPSCAMDDPGVPMEVPFDPNLTCPHCGRQFRKGCIQSFREHARSCQ